MARMPELPEVETTVRRLRKKIIGRRIERFEATWPRQVSPSIAGVRRAVVGRKIEKLSRRGKYIVFHLDDGSFLLVHLGMSGSFSWGGEEPAHVRAAWELDDGGRLLFCDARKFGRIRAVNDPGKCLRRLGPEPLSSGFTVEAFRRALAARSRQLKPLLMDQGVVCGLGNIYTDESLHRARLHPLSRSDSLTPEQVKRLHRAIVQTLKTAIRLSGTSFDWAYPGGRMQDRLRVYGRTGEPCKRCGGKIKRILVGGRGTHFCPACQRMTFLLPHSRVGKGGGREGG
jgi:formamidopyrimidine-DNA glycosylase